VRTARQVLRWAIPGWCMIGFFYFFLIVRAAFLSISMKIGSALGVDQLAKTGTVRTLGGELLLDPSMLVLVFGGLGLASGFVISQLYFWAHWRVTRIPFVPGAICPSDRGGDVLLAVDGLADTVRGELRLPLHATPTQIAWIWALFKHRPFSYLVSRLYIIDPSETAQTTRALELKYQENWYTALVVWYLAIARNGARDQLAGDLHHLLDIYHAIGCVRVGLVLAYPCYAIYEIIFNPTHPFAKIGASWILAVLAATGLGACLLHKGLTSNYRRTCYELMHLMQFTIQATWNADPGVFMARTGNPWWRRLAGMLSLWRTSRQDQEPAHAR